MNTRNEIAHARRAGEQLEELLVRRKQCPNEPRHFLLIGYWSLIIDYHKGILALLSNDLFGSALALVRPAVEAVMVSHLVVKGTDAVVERIRKGTHQTNFKKVGKWIDIEFVMEGLFEKFLKDALKPMHSFTHSGVLQLARPFDGNDVTPNYPVEEITGAIQTATSAVFMVTNLATKHFGFVEEWETAGQVFDEYGKRSDGSNQPVLKGGL